MPRSSFCLHTLFYIVIRRKYVLCSPIPNILHRNLSSIVYLSLHSNIAAFDALPHAEFPLVPIYRQCSNRQKQFQEK
ncbi:hypothetical protein F5Y02DRAFT_381276 [Annulohypoxylon stygium]|nr:hypothetical protein F5Y02DRAFT_381276 [Annulohypoxylon stygium]